MSLVELLIVVGVIGIVAAIAIPSISNIREVAEKTAAIQNAKNIQQMSGTLAALGVAHVIPDSMGGVAATARLLREGVIVPEGPMAGEKFVLSGLRDDEIDSISKYLYVQYDDTELRLIFQNPDLDPAAAVLKAVEGMACSLGDRILAIKSLAVVALPGISALR